MRHQEVTPGWYGMGLADGNYAWLVQGSHVETSRGNIPLPFGEDVLFLSCHLWGGTLFIAGQGHNTDAGWLWNGTRWDEIVPKTFGPQGMAFEADKLYVVTGLAEVKIFEITTQTFLTTRPVQMGANGIRQVIGGVMISGDQTYYDPSTGMHEWSQLVDVMVGLSDDDQAVIWDGTARRLLRKEGRTRFVKGHRVGDAICMSFQDQLANEGHLFFLSRQEISTLPLHSIIPPKGSPVDPNEEDAPFLARIKALEILTAEQDGDLDRLTGAVNALLQTTADLSEEIRIARAAAAAAAHKGDPLALNGTIEFKLPSFLGGRAYTLPVTVTGTL